MNETDRARFCLAYETERRRGHTEEPLSELTPELIQRFCEITPGEAFRRAERELAALQHLQVTVLPALAPQYPSQH